MLYLTTVHTDKAESVLDRALASLLAAFAKRTGQATPPVPPPQLPPCLYKMYYEQLGSGDTPKRQRPEGSAERAPLRQESVLRFPPLSADLLVSDASLDAVRVAWMHVMGHRRDSHADVIGRSSDEYMVFEDREGGDMDDNDAYD